jgi:RNA polymerase sigma factor (sigma-70 family)
VSYLGYVGYGLSAVSVTFGAMRWREARAWKEEARRMTSALAALTEEIRALKPAGTDRVAAEVGSNSDRLALSEAEVRQELADEIARLPEREKLVVTLYYYEDLTLREIGEVLGVTEARVSQLHTQAILRLKARLADRTYANA